MAVDETYVTFIKDQMSEIPNVDTKRMFGGLGFFREGIMFAMIGGGKFRLRADATNIPDFEKHGMENYRPNPKTKGMPYWEVPIEIMEDKGLLAEWVEKSYAVALSHKK